MPTKKAQPKKKTATPKKEPAKKKPAPRKTAQQKERIFVNEYIKTGNATKSAIKAGYSAKTARQAGTRLLSKVHVQEEIEKRMAKADKDSIMTAQEVMEYFTAVARGEIKDQFGLEASLSERTRAAQEIAKRTVDLENRKNGNADTVIAVKLDWGR